MAPLAAVVGRQTSSPLSPEVVIVVMHALPTPCSWVSTPGLALLAIVVGCSAQQGTLDFPSSAQPAYQNVPWVVAGRGDRHHCHSEGWPDCSAALPLGMLQVAVDEDGAPILLVVQCVDVDGVHGCGRTCRACWDPQHPRKLGGYYDALGWGRSWPRHPRAGADVRLLQSSCPGDGPFSIRSAPVPAPWEHARGFGTGGSSSFPPCVHDVRGARLVAAVVVSSWRCLS
ncbi:hypothetical protein SETIT_1G233600v2 [Setaria italica]|uniref:Uncharacterized protein n=1 Tax=Setaria italica TaxID=4555 RepID=A0A368PNT3_SETIT|nr:hypothetical protein SETIT_1G233600v2 [Setaria italica]